MHPAHLQNEVRALEVMVGATGHKANSVTQTPAPPAGADSLHELVGRIRGLLADVRAKEAKALPEWEASTERHEWAALYRCGNKLEEALGSLATIAPNEKLTDGADRNA